jgi:hypothetical protein
MLASPVVGVFLGLFSFRVLRSVKRIEIMQQIESE